MKKTRAWKRQPRGRRLSERQSRAWESELRSRLGLPTSTLPAQIRLWGWIATAVTGFIALVTRFWELSHPHQMVFDETYYVKAGYSFVVHGYERNWVGENADEMFVQGTDAAAELAADYVVHPPLGKWLIGFGQAIFGTDNGFGWRFATAVAGIIGVMLLTRIALRMFRSVPLAFLAGFFMAIDGVGIVLSRTGILDNLLATFVMAGFWAVLRDRDATRAKLAHRVAHGPVSKSGKPLSYLGPIILWRPWLLLAGLLIGMGCGVKWSAAYALAVFGILVFCWDTAARKELGVKGWFASGIVTGGVPAFLSFIPIALVTYVSSWTSWFLDPRGYKRGWAESQRLIGEEVPFENLGDPIAELIEYHRQMWEFHTGLSSEHTYMSQPWDWIFQLRPVNFYWPPEEKLVQDCGAERCVQAISSVGNPGIWWLAAVSLILVLWYAIRKGDWRAWAILAGYGAMYLPWFNYIGRTVYQFYSVAFLPYVVLALIFALAWVTDMLGEPSLAAIRKAAAKRRKKELDEDWSIAMPGEGKHTQDDEEDPLDRYRTDTPQDPDDPDLDGSPDIDWPNREDFTLGADDTTTAPTGQGLEDLDPETIAHLVAEDDIDGGSTEVTEGQDGTKPSDDKADSHHGSPVNAQPSANVAGSEDENGTALSSRAERIATENSGLADSIDPDMDPIERAVLLEHGPDPLPYTLLPARKKDWVVLGVTAGLTLALSIFWWPLWTGMTIPYDFWKMHIWLPGWS